MTFDQVYQRALDGITISGVTVHAWQGSATEDGDSHRREEAYLIFNEAQADFILDASNEARRVRHLVQVHVFTREPLMIDPLLKTIYRNLRKAKVKPMYTAARTYEDDTGFWHQPMYTHYYEDLNGGT